MSVELGALWAAQHTYLITLSSAQTELDLNPDMATCQLGDSVTVS
jgi:hypothetical protein